jgi:predicted enzyme related to lactoylglutathione lyase
MKRVTGLGGIFFKAKDAEKLRAWYATHLVDGKIDESEYGRFGWATDPEGNRFELWEPPKDKPPGSG